MAAFGLSLAAGLLMVVEAIIATIAAGVASDLGSPEGSAVLSGLALLGLLFGLLVLLLATLLYRNPDQHLGYGVAILVVSLISVFGGGGFFLGLVLGVIGGILAIVFVPEDETEPMPELGLRRPVNGFGQPGHRPDARPVPTPVPPGICPNCRASVLPGLDLCPNCETPMRSYSATVGTGSNNSSASRG